MTSNGIKAIIFDMDGVLIDSEPSWQQAEFETMQALGLPLSYEDTLQTTGLRIDQVVSYWYQRYPWANYDNANTAKAIVDKVVAQIKQNGSAMKGVENALNYCRQHHYHIGLATSSSTAIIEAVLNKLQIGQYFNAIQSAEDLRYGKPHPEVYLLCAQQLGIAPHQCLAIEDSFNGLIAAKAANMQTCIIPAAEQAQQARWVLAEHQLANLDQLAELLLAN
ncbi:hexitol phosphatase HxpB [Shewanella waksmanii]|uniref:hexitol phosphatase HxpB n=1 Tax=Shewanella waksmanii TaxID=213783 RepID=UPI003735781D